MPAGTDNYQTLPSLPTLPHTHTDSHTHIHSCYFVYVHVCACVCADVIYFADAVVFALIGSAS